MRRREPKRTAIAGCEQAVLVVAAAFPHRTDGMNDVLRRQPVAAGDFGVAGFAAAQPPAFQEQFRPRRAMDRAVDSATAKQGTVRGIDDGV